MDDGLVDLPAAGHATAEVVVGLRVVGLDFQGLPIMATASSTRSAVDQGALPRLIVGTVVRRRLATVSCQIAMALW